MSTLPLQGILKFPIAQPQIPRRAGRAASNGSGRLVGDRL